MHLSNLIWWNTPGYFWVCTWGVQLKHILNSYRVPCISCLNTQMPIWRITCYWPQEWIQLALLLRIRKTRERCFLRTFEIVTCKYSVQEKRTVAPSQDCIGDWSGFSVLNRLFLAPCVLATWLETWFIFYTFNFYLINPFLGDKSLRNVYFGSIQTLSSIPLCLLPKWDLEQKTRFL